MDQKGNNLKDYCTPRIIVISDGQGRGKWKRPLEEAKENNIIIDCIALLSKSQKGKDTLKTIAHSTKGFPPPEDMRSYINTQKGEFILPENLNRFLSHLETLSNKKYGTRQEDTVLCLDSSGSMSSNYKGSEERKIDGLKNAVEKFIISKQKADPRDRVGVVAFGVKGGNNVKKLIHLSVDKNQIMDQVNKLTPEDGTPLGKGIEMALDLLDWENRANNFEAMDAIPINAPSKVPSNTDCEYCVKTMGRMPEISSDTFDVFSGAYNIGAWKCPECGAYFHGACFEKHNFTSKKWGMCYNCLKPLRVPRKLRKEKYL